MVLALNPNDDNLPAFDDKNLNLGWFLATSKALSRQASVAELADAPDSAR